MKKQPVGNSDKFDSKGSDTGTWTEVTGQSEEYNP